MNNNLKYITVKIKIKQFLKLTHPVPSTKSGLSVKSAKMARIY